jgi:hypothetical protein
MTKIINKDILLDPVTHDLLISNFDLGFTDAKQLTMQKIKRTLLLFEGEWFLNNNIGMPYFTEILNKNNSLIRIKTLYIRAIKNIPEVLEILEFNIEQNISDRKLTIDFKVRDEDNNILKINL